MSSIAIVLIVVGTVVTITGLVRHKRRWKFTGKFGFLSFSVEADDGYSHENTRTTQ